MRLTFFFFLLLQGTLVSAQPKWISILDQVNDSVTSGAFEGSKDLALEWMGQAKKEKNDTVIAQLFFGIALGYYRIDPYAGIPFLDSSIYYSERQENYSASIRYHNAKSSFLKKVGDLQEAKSTSLSAYFLAKAKSPDRLFLSARNVSVNYRLLGQYDSALYYILIADSLARRAGDAKLEYLALQGASNIYLDMKNYEEAIKIIPLLKGGSPGDEMYELMNLGLAYFGLHALDSSLMAFDRSFLLAEQTNDTIVMATLLGQIGEVYLEQDKLDTAIHTLKKSLFLSKSSKPDDLIAMNNILLSRALTRKGRYQEALKDAERAHAIAKDLMHEEFQLSSLVILGEINSILGNMQAAYDYSLTYRELYHKVNESQRVKTVEILKKQFETERKERQIASLAQQNEIKDLQLDRQQIIMTAAFAIFSLVLVVGILLYRQNRSKQQQRQLSIEQNLLRTQMNPHFIFNALASIQGFITRDNRREAATYLAKFGELTRDILEASRKELIPLTKEIEMIKNYVQLEQVRFSKSLDLEIIQSGFDENDELMVPPMMVQPFLENAIKHGLRGRDSGKISIRIEKNEQVLHLSIEDDGAGLDENVPKSEQSLATTIAKERLHHLRKYEKNLKMNIANRTNETGKVSGVIVTMDLPIIYGH
ncbi:MAG: histidine kinase [Cyclobacteriaceae bacterium]